METSVAIILKKDLPIGLAGNICACLATGIINLNSQIIGHDIVAADLVYKAITKVPIVVLNENKLGINEVIRRAKRNKLDFVLYDKHAVRATDYDQYGRDIQATKPEEREILGIGIIGEQKNVRNVIGDLPLLK
jgi:hypothetical protein